MIQEKLKQTLKVSYTEEGVEEVFTNLLKKKSVKAIYNDALRWLDEKNASKELLDISIGASSSDSGESSSSSRDEANQANDIKFTINVTYDVWQTIEPVPDILIDRLSHHKINNACTWTFKRAKVHISGQRYIVLSAKCTTCRALLLGGVTEMHKKKSQ